MPPSTRNSLPVMAGRPIRGEKKGCVPFPGLPQRYRDVHQAALFFLRYSEIHKEVPVRIGTGRQRVHPDVLRAWMMVILAAHYGKHGSSWPCRRAVAAVSGAPRREAVDDGAAARPPQGLERHIYTRKYPLDVDIHVSPQMVSSVPTASPSSLHDAGIVEEDGQRQSHLSAKSHHLSPVGGFGTSAWQ